MIFLYLVDIYLISASDKRIHIILIIAVFRCCQQKISNPDPLLPFKVIHQGVPKLSRSHAFILKNTFFYCCEGISHVGNSYLEAADKVIDGSAFFQCLSPSDTVLHQRGTQHVGHCLLQNHITAGLYNYAVLREIPDNFIPGTFHVSIAGHIPEMSRAFTQFHSRLRIHAVIHCYQQGFGEIQETHSGAAVSPFPRHCRLYTADCTVIIRVFLLDSLFNEGGDNNLIIIKGWHAKPQTHHFDAFVHKFSAESGMVTDRQIGLGQLCLSHAL